ncbi:MAG: Polyphosphate kinase [Gemmatimonadetes bacterium]|nr:Polyphosphate kinase [Gemmatimonadota bacterium]
MAEEGTGERVLAFEVATRETLDRLAHEPLPAALREEGRARTHFRDVFWDTGDGGLERRGITVRLRWNGDGTRTLAVRVQPRGEAPLADGAEEWRTELAPPAAGEDADALPADGSDVGLRLRALVDPARLVPALEVETDRATRRAHPLGAPEQTVRLHTDALTVRAGGTAAVLFGLEVHLPPGANGDAAEAARLLAEEFGLRPAPADPRSRVAERLAELGLDAEERALRQSRRVAVLAMRGCALALRHREGVLRVPAGHGQGEEACRRVLRGCFGNASGKLRLLGTSPGAGARPATEVWLAEGADPEPHGACAGDLAWVPVEELFASVGSPALRDAATLAALNVLARAELPVAAEDPADLSEGGRAAAAAALRGLAAVEEAHYAGGEAERGTLLNMELSMLAFNRRVLALAEDAQVPLFERLRFLSIFCANLDEFFRVRVAAFKRQVAAGSAKRTMDGVSPAEQLDAIGIRARGLLDRAYGTLFEGLLPELRARGIGIVRPRELDAEGTAWLADYFRAQVQPTLTPLAAGPGHPFPHVRNMRPAMCAVVRQPASGVERFVVLELPGDLPRFVDVRGARLFVPLEDVIRTWLGELYPGLEVEGAWTFRVTRSAELELDPRRATDLLSAVEEQVRRRPFQPVVRLEVERDMPGRVRRLLLRELQFEDGRGAATLGEADVYVADWLIDLRGLREIADLPGEGVHYPPAAASVPLDPERSIFEVLREREVLVHFPFDSFEASVERFVLEAADDPDVVSIKLALYRTDRRSRIVEALRRASARGKQVVALVELTARFDEQRNIEWARYLRAAGIHVIYGVPGVKVHAKVALALRREGGALRHYLYVGTGNLNATTAALYTDLGLLSADPQMGEDLNGLFNTLTGYTGRPDYQVLLAAPHNMRPRFVEMIGREAGHARAGRGGSIRAKMNGLADREIIDALYAASQAGATVELVVRGLCSLRPGVAGLSENIRVVSILGRYLEHGRIFRFGNAGRPDYYIGSADWRTRNLSKRVEVAAPVRDPAHRRRLDEIMEQQLGSPDAWELGSDGTYYRRPEPAPHANPRPAGAEGRRLILTPAMSDGDGLAASAGG